MTRQYKQTQALLGCKYALLSPDVNHGASDTGVCWYQTLAEAKHAQRRAGEGLILKDTGYRIRGGRI